MTQHSHVDAMSVQLAQLHARLAQGMPRRGWKVGINVPEVQQKLGLGHALVGWLDGDRVLDDGASVSAEPGSLLHAEPELCVRLGARVEVLLARGTARFDAGSTVDVALAAIDAVAPALEIVDYAKAKGSLADIIGHSMFHHACVLGAFRPLPAGASLAIAPGVRFRVGELESEPARSDLVPVSAAELVLQVATRLAECGEALLPGDLILSGSFTAKALQLRPGVEARAQLGEFGAVGCRLSGA